MQSPLFIINPASGSHRAGGEISRLLARAEHLYGRVSAQQTERRGHAEELALAGAKTGHPLIVAVGGDGTFSEVANGVLRAQAAGAEPSAVGLVSIGTGGDLRRTLGIDAGIEASLEVLATGTDRPVDVIRVEFADRAGKPKTRYVTNVVSAGLGGLVDRYIESTPSFVPGRVGYYAASLRAAAVSTQQPLKAQVQWQGETREETIPAYLIAVCNGRWFGGGMDVAPMAAPDDGRLEVVVVASPTKTYLLRNIKSVYEGRHLDLPCVSHFACSRVTLSLDDAAAARRFLLDVDGDALGSLPLTAEVLPAALRVRCGAGRS